jgi:nicotinic acetylcholine receptor
MRQFLVALLFALAVAKINGDAVDGSAPTKFKTSETASQADRDKLLDDLFKDYKPYSYPSNSTVGFGVSVLNVDLNQETNQMETSVWLKISWTDSRLVWDAEEKGVNVIRVPPSKVWIPDVTLYNSANQNQRMSCWESNVLIYSTGKVLWVPPCHLQSFCNLTLSRTPFKEQTCTLKFGSWTFDGLTLGLDFWENKKLVDTNDFAGSSKFEITKNTAVRTEKFYDCCVEPYIDLTFTLGLTQIDNTIHKCDGKN